MFRFPAIRIQRPAAAVSMATCCVLAGLLGTPVLAQPDVSFVVDELGDAGDANPGDGQALTAGGVTTLRAAMEEVEALDVCGEITFDAALFAAPAAITLTSPIDVQGCFNIVGPGADTLTLDAANQFRIFRFVDSTVLIEGMTLTRGKVGLGTGIRGGAINCNGTVLTLRNCSIIECQADYGGGGVFMGDDLTGPNGDIVGALVVDRCVFHANQCGQTGGSSVGGAIMCSDQDGQINTTVVASLFEDNVTQANGSAVRIEWGKIVTVGRSTFRNNAGSSTLSLNAGDAAVFDCVAHDNIADGGGGAIEWLGITLRINNCTFFNNFALYGGGAVYLKGNDAEMLNCTVLSNSSGGDGSGGGVYVKSGTLTLGNTIMANNTDSENVGPDVSGSITSWGGNLIGNGRGGTGYLEVQDLVGTDESPIDPLLGHLSDNGGPTLTMMPLEGSPAINAGNNSLITADVFGDPAWDQRGWGFQRIKEDIVDIGAVESGPDLTPPVITLLGASPLAYECGTVYVEPGVTAIDELDGDLSVSVEITGTVDTATPGEYSLTYNVSDTAGNPAVPVERTVVVSDTTPPVITLLGEVTVNLACHEAYAEPGATAEDGCDAALPEIDIDTSALNVDVSGEYAIVYTVSDASGNVGEASRIVVVGTCNHSADQNGDYLIQLTELLRIIQFFNSGGLHCADDPGSTEDGFAPGPGANTSCRPHSSDYFSSGPDWQIALTELLRIIQFFNSGGYHACAGEGTEDGFCPGL